jgi:hypothetical protein
MVDLEAVNPLLRWLPINLCPLVCTENLRETENALKKMVFLAWGNLLKVLCM